MDFIVIWIATKIIFLLFMKKSKWENFHLKVNFMNCAITAHNAASISRCWPLTTCFAHAERPLPPLLLPSPAFDCCYCYFWLIFLLYLSLIAHCTMTAVLTTCCCCATIALVSLAIAGCHQMIVDFYCCACCQCSLCQCHHQSHRCFYIYFNFWF